MYLRILSLLLVFCFSHSFAQKSDSIIRVLSSVKPAETRLHKANSVCEKLWLSGQYTDGLAVGNYALREAIAAGNKKEEAAALNNIGIINDYLGDYAESLSNYFKALALYESMGNADGEANVCSNIGLIYGNQRKFAKALSYHRRSLALRKRIKNMRGISTSHNNIGIVYMDMNNFPAALENYSASVEIDRKLGDERGMGDSYSNIGLIYMELKEFEKAEEYFRRSEKLRIKFKDELGLSNTYINLGTLFFNQKKFALAEEAILKGLDYSKKLGAKGSISHCYELLTDLYEKQQKYKEGLQAFRYFAAYSDSLANDDITRIQTEAEMQYQFDKEKIITEKKQEQLWLGIFCAAILACMLLFFAIIIFRRLRITRSQKIEIESKNQLVEEKNREILDSITYAKRIQSAILPSEKLVKSLLKDSFILYKPKDIVAGDFYWMEHQGDKLIFAAADCTGHGVPGALVSVVCHNALNRSVREFGYTEPGLILDKTREIVLEEFAKSEEEVNDGMDISLCTLDLNTFQLQWSGANNPLWILREGNETINEFRPSKQPIGRYSKYSAFETNHIQLEKNDALYLFTDGFADQFGGPDGKKFKVSRMKELVIRLRGKSMNEQLEAFESVFSGWKQNTEQIDDVCVIGVRI